MNLKKIGSEIKYSNDKFSIKIGTMDKKNPKTIYGVLGTYICPNVEKESYEEDINIFNKKSKENFHKLMSFSNDCDSINNIFLTEVADTRIKQGKKSYLEIQFYIKPNFEFISENNYDFKSLSSIINDTYCKKIIDFTQSELNSHNFQCYKTKR